ncbi:MAG: hypothetical protein JNK05_05285 [Myxococcales bacterium]|nr:hypothetical protein [Myxococcales bacterium]
MTVPMDLEARVRARMTRTGESYTTALAATKRAESLQPPPSPIAGWITAGDAPWGYRFGVDVEEGVRSARIEHIDPTCQGFATLMQMIDAADYRAKRVRWSAEVRCDNITNFAGLWMRVDGRAREILAFDNMSERPLVGTRAWARADVVLEVDDSALAVAFGALLHGPGTLSFRRASFEAVASDVPVTAQSIATHPRQPRNLSFDP